MMLDPVRKRERGSAAIGVVRRRDGSG